MTERCKVHQKSKIWDTHTHTQVGFKMFLGVVPTVGNWSAKGDEFSLILDQNPLVDFVELPETHQGLLYSNIICGVIRGALEMVCLCLQYDSHSIRIQ